MPRPTSDAADVTLANRGLIKNGLLKKRVRIREPEEMPPVVRTYEDTIDGQTVTIRVFPTPKEQW